MRTLLLLPLLLSCAPSPPAPVVAHVVRAGDGDTIDVTIAGRRERVRLLGVDTPELGDSDPALRSLAKQAHRFTATTLVGADVRLVPGGPDDRDKYGRLLRYVELSDGSDFNARLLREGFACAYRVFDHPRKRTYLELESEAGKAHPERDPCADHRRHVRPRKDP